MSSLKKGITIALVMLTAFLGCYLAGLSLQLAITISATVGVAIFELLHVRTVWPTLIGLGGLIVLYVINNNVHHLTEVLHHEYQGMVSLFLLLVGGSLMASYILPHTRLIPVISHILPSERFLPLAIYVIGGGFSYISPVMGAVFMLTLINYEYKSNNGLIVLGAVFVANAIAAMSPLSDVGSVLVANGIGMPATWKFVVPFVIICGLLASFYGKQTTTQASDKFKQKLNLRETGMLVILIIALVVGQKVTGYVWPGMLAIIIYIFVHYPKKTDSHGSIKSINSLAKERKHLWKDLLASSMGFSFLPVLVLLWGCVQADVPSLFGQFDAFKTYLLAPASGCFDNVALTVGILKESVNWFMAILGLCIGGSMLPFSSAASAAMNEKAKLSMGKWFVSAIPFFVVYTIMWWITQAVI
jgi:hypothetical protein